MRGPTSKRWLKIDWTYPVYSDPAAEAADGSSAGWAGRALPTELAFDALASGDRRPLLVLRECNTCSGTDDALLSKTEDNERTFLLSQWFRCVKLPPDVLTNENHSFHGLFASEDPGSSHLFVARWDGSGRLDLDGAQSRRELWQKMETLIESEYAGKPDSAVKGLGKLLDRFDRLDAKIAQLEVKRDKLIEKVGPSSRKLAKVARELEKARAQRDDALEQSKRLAALELVAAVPTESVERDG